MALNNLSTLIRDHIVPIKTALHIDFTVQQALDYIRKMHIDDKIIYFYVVDDEQKLLGVLPTRHLLLNEHETPISQIMEPSVVCLKDTQTLQEAMEFLESHRLLALPVVDDKNHLLGVIDIGLYLEETVDIANARRRSDLFQLIGIYVEEGKKPSAWHGYRARMPWILCNLFGGLACAVISRIFELVLVKVLLLAMFIPLLLTLSESISMQSMTQSMQLIKRQTHRFKYIMQCLFREWQIVGMLATSCGIAVGIISLLWGGGVGAGLTIGIGIMFSVFISASIGSAIPLILHARNWDPHVAAGPIVLMFADVLTTALYLSLATWWLL